jgi:HEAT repeat protein
MRTSESPNVRIAAAEALAHCGEKSDYDKSLAVLLDASSPGENGAIVPIAALNALDRLGLPSKATAEKLATFPLTGKSPHARYADYAGRLLKDLLGVK